jgi:hypothetical protein
MILRHGIVRRFFHIGCGKILQFADDQYCYNAKPIFEATQGNCVPEKTESRFNETPSD